MNHITRTGSTCTLGLMFSLCRIIFASGSPVFRVGAIITWGYPNSHGDTPIIFNSWKVYFKNHETYQNKMPSKIIKHHRYLGAPHISGTLYMACQNFPFMAEFPIGKMSRPVHGIMFQGRSEPSRILLVWTQRWGNSHRRTRHFHEELWEK